MKCRKNSYCHLILVTELVHCSHDLIVFQLQKGKMPFGSIDILMTDLCLNCNCICITLFKPVTGMDPM